MTDITRFAPSPTGYLHLGHAYSALFAARHGWRAGGRFILRIEDIDSGRCRPQFERAIYEDLIWLGLDWERPVLRQSDHMATYRQALDRLHDRGLLYPCFCTRREIVAEINAAGRAPHGPEGVLYPGTCARLSASETAERIESGQEFALRLHMSDAIKQAGHLTWRDTIAGEVTADASIFGDVVLARKDVPTSYHLASACDDHRQGVTYVTRGTDLFQATHIHRLLQHLLDLTVPRYCHHRLITDPSGKRFAKRDGAATLRQIRQSGKSPEDIFEQIDWQGPP